MDDIQFIGFADNKVPEFKEVKSKDWVLYGTDNKFPEHLLYLYNKSSNHNAIVDAKTTYICGKGFPVNQPVNIAGETVNTLMKKICKDIEIFGGFRLQAIRLMNGRLDWTHIPFHRIRTGKNGKTFWYKKDWTRMNPDDKPRQLAVFNPEDKMQTAAIFAYNEYRPSCDVYPLPGYFGGTNDIETDVEISKYNLSIIKNGMFSGKMLVFRSGEPSQDKKREIERDFKDKFAGSGNAGKFMIAYIKNGDTPPDVIDMSTTDLDKLFDQLNKTTQNEIFSCHRFPTILAGISDPGKLGVTNEIQYAYSQFKNTYVNEKQQNLETVFDFLAPYMGLPQGQKIQPVDPIDTILSPVDFKDILPKEWVFDQLGIDPEEYPTDNVSGTPSPIMQQVNEHIKGLSGRQNQNLMRIIRQFKKGQITRQMAEILLSKGYNLMPEDINTFLSFADIQNEIEVAEMFCAIGRPREEYTILKTKSVIFSELYNEFADINQTDSNILNLIGKDHKITPEVIAKTLHEKPEYIRARINSLKERGVITEKPQTIGVDTIIEYAINPETIDTREKPETVDVYVRYSYEPKPGLQPIIETTRPFCRKLIELDRLYSRAEIELISQRVGYSVFDRKGGFWGSNEECRHRWVSNIVIKKR